jgi:hypothetical protein
VVALWTRPSTHAELYPQIQRLWADEFFNRSVRDVASAAGPLPDGLAVRKLTVRTDGCLEAAVPSKPQYAVADASRLLTARVVRTNPSTRAILYRLRPGSPGRCLAHLQQP